MATASSMKEVNMAIDQITGGIPSSDLKEVLEDWMRSYHGVKLINLDARTAEEKLKANTSKTRINNHSYIF